VKRFEFSVAVIFNPLNVYAHVCARPLSVIKPTFTPYNQALAPASIVAIPPVC